MGGQDGSHSVRVLKLQAKKKNPGSMGKILLVVNITEYINTNIAIFTPAMAVPS